jgi:pimeloyl-ACP methyl ester carboxylesterase
MMLGTYDGFIKRVKGLRRMKTYMTFLVMSGFKPSFKVLTVRWGEVTRQILCLALISILNFLNVNNAMANMEDTQRLTLASGLLIHVRTATVPNALGDVVYVHGATFSSELSVFHQFDGNAWSNALNAAGFNVWGFDFAGYGLSSRYDSTSPRPRGGVDEALPQLQAVIEHVRRRNGGNKVALLAHSWGTVVASRYAGLQPKAVQALILFGPPVTRLPDHKTDLNQEDSKKLLPSHYPLSAWAQYRRFVEDVPRGENQVLSEAHFDAWRSAWLATDVSAETRRPPSVMTPYGPVADLTTMWSGGELYDASQITAPTLIVRGEWDSVCNDADANRLLKSLGATDKSDIKIVRASHLMHLESQRTLLHNTVNTFLQRTTVKRTK